MSTITDLYRKLFGRKGTERGTDIDMAEHGRVGGLSTGQPYKFTDIVNYAIILLESGGFTYVAFATPGSISTDAVWRVMKLDTATGLVMQWADGNTNFDNKADDLANLNYS